jgi:hypothetical protein
MPLQYPITVQAIRSKGCNPRLYVYVPMSLATAIGLEPGEKVQWTLLTRETLQLQRSVAPSESQNSAPRIPGRETDRCP